MKGARSLSRRCIVQALYQWQLHGGIDDVDLQYIREKTKGRVDEAYFVGQFREILDHVEELDRLLEPLLDRALSDVDPVERAILRLGGYELKYRLDIPYRVVLNEAVELAKLFGAEQGHRYINGILDALAARLRTAETGAGGK